MTQPRRSAGGVVLLALLLVTGLVCAPANSAGSAGRSGVTGQDGQSYPSANLVVAGRDGQYFYGPDFDGACAFGGKGLEQPMTAINRLAKLIRHSGREVLWTVAPASTAVMTKSIVRGTLPQGECDTVGFKQQRKVLDDFEGPDYVPVRQDLIDDRRKVYFKTDNHWTTIGATVWARAIAHRLSVGLAKRQSYTYTEEQVSGLLYKIAGSDEKETVSVARPSAGVRVRTAPSSVDPFAEYPDLVYDHTWTSRPARLTWPGRTLLLGDSFSAVGLEVFRPMFRHGRYMWLGHVEQADLIQAIKQSDTVVLEQLQTFVQLRSSDLTSATFRKELRRALR